VAITDIDFIFSFSPITFKMKIVPDESETSSNNIGDPVKTMDPTNDMEAKVDKEKQNIART